MFESLFTWDVLATYAGAVAMTFLIVLYTKHIVDMVWPKWLGTDLYAVLVGSALILMASFFTTGEITVAIVILALLNGFVIALGAGKLHDKTINDHDKKIAAKDDYLDLMGSELYNINTSSHAPEIKRQDYSSEDDDNDDGGK